MEMTRFQSHVIKKLDPIIAHTGISLRRCEDKDLPVSDIYLVSEKPKLKIWIYGDNEILDRGVAFELEDFSLECELQDFDSCEQMTEFFLGSITTALRMKGWG